MDLTGTVVTVDALHTQAETARHLVEDKHAHYLMIIIKGNQPFLFAAAAQALAGPDSGFAAASWAEEGTGHGRRERRAIRAAPADAISWPHAAQILRIRRDTGPTHGPWTRKEIAYGITSLPPDLAGPRHLATYARQHRAIENREHYGTRPSAKISSRPAPGTSRTPTPSSATWSPAPSAAPGTPTSPMPAAPTAATTSASSPFMDTPDAGAAADGLGDIFDDRDEPGTPVAVAPGELHQFAGAGQDRAPVRGPDDGDPPPAAELQQPSSRSRRSARSTVLLFTFSTAARSRAGGSRSPGRTSPSAMARRISAHTWSWRGSRSPRSTLTASMVPVRLAP